MDFFLQLAGGFLIGFVAAVSPGPDTVIVLRSVAAGGSRAGTRATFGIGAALTIHAAITIAVVGAVRDVAGSPVLKAIQLIGAAYLAYMGVLLLRSSIARPENGAIPPVETGPQDTGYFLQGFITNLTNPKAIVFFASVVSQFISAGDSGSGVAVLAGVVTAVPTWFLLLSYSSARVMGRLTASRRRVVDIVAGCLFLALACFGALSALQG